jgi:hypothetical protein
VRGVEGRCGKERLDGTGITLESVGEVGEGKTGDFTGIRAERREGDSA